MVRMKMIKSIPSFLYLLLLYNFILMLGQSWDSDSSTLKFVVFDLDLASGNVISFYVEHILLILGMIDVIAGFTISISNTRNAQFVTPSELPR